jgi:hypothetical protein
MNIPLRCTAVLAIVALAACGAADIVKVIDSAAQIGVEAATVAGAIPPEYSAYVSAGLACIDNAAIEIASTTDTDAQKAAKVAGFCAGLAAPALPPGTPANLVALAGRLSTAIANILARTAVGTKALPGKASPVTVLSDRDRQQLEVDSLKVRIANRIIRK